ncbi:MAG TPA: hypothetical protein VFK33_00370 [Bacillales bacterium]|nr:hypothetical protein [Bacillales bacterium]
MNKNLLIVSFMLALLFSVFTLKPAFAAGNGDGNHDTVIEQGQKVETVVVFGNDAVVKGTVNEGVIVIDGNLNIKSTADIHGVVLVIGGHVQQQAGAKVTEDVLSFAFGHGIKFGFLLAATLLAASWLARLALSLLFLILAFAAGLWLKDKLDPLQSTVRRTPGKLILIGAITSVLLTAVDLLLVISVIGIPVAAVLLILPFVFFCIGLAVTGRMTAEKLVGYQGRPPWRNLIYGLLLVVACINFPFLGGLLLLGLIWLSTGLMVIWIYEWARARKSIAK